VRPFRYRVHDTTGDDLGLLEVVVAPSRIEADDSLP
jgi:hypothetical protein